MQSCYLSCGINRGRIRHYDSRVTGARSASVKNNCFLLKWKSSKWSPIKHVSELELLLYWMVIWVRSEMVIYSFIGARV